MVTHVFLVILYLLLSDIPADDILELFGKTFFDFCQDSGYDKILQVLGATPRDFLQVSIQTVIRAYNMLIIFIVMKICFLEFLTY